jgi:hypothetical protein
MAGELYPGQHFGCLVQLCAWAAQVATLFLPLSTDAKIAIGFGSLAVMAIPAIAACAVLYYRWKRQPRTATKP